MKITKGLRRYIFENTYNNSTIWDYYREHNYTRRQKHCFGRL